MRTTIGVIATMVLWCTLSAVAFAQEAPAWAARGEALARRVEAGNMIITESVRREREALAGRQHGEQRLMTLYDLAADDYVASDADAAAVSITRLEREAQAQNSARYRAMAAMLRAYAPALEGDYVAARDNLRAALARNSDPYANAAGARLLAYALTDLGLFGNSLEAARGGLVRLPETPETRPLRSGLYDAMSYNSVRVGDYDGALSHLERTVELDLASGRPIDGAVLINNVASMLAQAGAFDAAKRLTLLHRNLAIRSHSPAQAFFSALLCAKVYFLAGEYGAALHCAEEGRKVADAPPEYLSRLLVYRVQALARLGRGADARSALNELRALAARRGDPSLSERLNIIEPEVLAAEGRASDAFLAMRAAHEAAERNLMTRFNDGVRELRATMESEVAQAEARAEAEAVRSELRERTLEAVALLALLVGACLVAVGLVALLIYRSRRAMLQAVGRAEEILARRGEAAAPVANDNAHRRNPTQRLAHILDEIERRDDELERAFKDLDAARQAAEEASQAKSQFLATVSHELRTPLNAIIGYSEMLLEAAQANEGDQSAQDVRRINLAGQRLLAMINDVLDFSKIEAGAMQLCVAPVELDALVADVIDTVRPAAVANGTTITAHTRALGAAETDGMKLSQCLLNLTANAAKFTRNGQVEVRGRREQKADGDWLVFDIVDNGIGISAEALTRLFQPFVQADASTTRAYGGTGLGLAITRRLANLLGGEVSVESAPGRGSVFTLRVPARARAPLAEAA
ncbi:MAG: hypothetical protein HXY28_14910 [Hydrogenophilaceae bacterium]|jgi:signal transduction histidine kinase|nr:hypothetical protein [Hydrogenophilaceae bacterium]